jgi:putative transposase
VSKLGTGNTVANWCRFSPSNISFKDLGSSWQNAYVESFNGKHCNELLGIEIFTTLLETKIMAEDYRQDYN